MLYDVQYLRLAINFLVHKFYRDLDDLIIAREDICLQTMFFVKFPGKETKEFSGWQINNNS